MDTPQRPSEGERDTNQIVASVLADDLDMDQVFTEQNVGEALLS